MAYSIIGSSNIYKHYNVSKFRGYKNYSMIKCTDVNNFEVKLSNSDDKFIVISVIENFIDKEVSSGLLKTKGEKADIMKLVENAVQVYSGVIKEAATRRPKAKFSEEINRERDRDRKILLEEVQVVLADGREAKLEDHELAYSKINTRSRHS